MNNFKEEQLDRIIELIRVIIELLRVIIELLRVQSHQKVAYNMDEAFEYTGISKSSLYKLTSGGKIPYHQPGNKLIWFKKSDLDDFMLSNRRATTAEIQAEAVGRVINKTTERSNHGV